jgi:hypothetical protein
MQQIIREEVHSAIHEGPFDILGEPTMKDLSVDITGKLKYVAARTLGGAVPSGAAAIAKGQVNITPTVAQALQIGWNSNEMGYYLTAMGAMADLIPGGGTAVSTAIGIAQIQRAVQQNDAFSAVLGAISLNPGVGDALGIMAKAFQKGLGKAAGPVAKALAKGLGGITQDEIVGAIKKFAPAISATFVTEIGKAYNKFKSDLEAATRSIPNPPSPAAVQPVTPPAPAQPVTPPAAPAQQISEKTIRRIIRSEIQRIDKVVNNKNGAKSKK